MDWGFKNLRRGMIGTLVGHYKVVRKIGDGGMGSVFEAVHEGIGRRVAIKVLRTEYSREANLVARFFNEARAVNIVSHPGIVGSFDYGQLPDGTAYIVMEYVEGESLAGRLKRLRAPLGPDSLRIGRQLAATLAAAHAKGIIHRDLKPDNIMIAADSEAPGGERAKVLDFGIAKIVSDADAKSTGLTQAGAVMGTPKYMSPEQCRGTGKVDFKTDVYALGIIIFEMLTGRIPFEAEGTGAMMAMHMFQPPPPLREIDPSIAPPVEQLVQAMMDKDPTKRPTMVEVVGQIEALGVKSTGVLSTVGPHAVAHETSGPVTTSRPSLVGLGQTQEPTKIRLGGERLRRLAVPIATAVVLSAIGLVVVLRRKDPPPPPVTTIMVPQKRVQWQILTTPPGAEVVRISDGQVLGVTPWKSEQPAGQGKVGVMLRRVGFVNRELLLARDVDTTEDLKMEPAAPPPTSTEKSGPGAGKKPGKTPKPSKKHENDNPFAPVR
jgi:hypothetical protein